MAWPAKSRRRYYAPISWDSNKSPRHFHNPIEWDLVSKERLSSNYTCDKCRIRDLLFEEFTSEQLRSWFIPKSHGIYQYHDIKMSLNRVFACMRIKPIEDESITCTLWYRRDDSYSKYSATFTPKEVGVSCIYEFDLDAARWLKFDLTPRDPPPRWPH